jgi:subtilisin-like proprotein convertase family protein
MRQFATRQLLVMAFAILALGLVLVHAQVLKTLGFHYNNPIRSLDKTAVIKADKKFIKKEPAIQKTASAAFSLPVISNKLVNNNVGAGPTAGFTQSETSILAFGNNVVFAYNDAGSYIVSGNKFTGFAFSTDGGNTVIDGGTLTNNALGDAGDPVLARNNTTGRIYLATLSFSGIGTIQVFRSDDNGATWLMPVIGTPGGSSENKPWITVDNFSGTGNGNVYLISKRYAGALGMFLFRSTDNGNTFAPAGGVPIAGINTEGGYVAVGPDHSIYAFYYEAPGVIKMRKSTDLGITFAAAVVVASGLIGGTNGDLNLVGIRQGTAVPAPFRTNEFVHVAINPVSGHLYATYNNHGAGADKADIFLVKSTDAGLTWSAPQRINDDITVTDQWMPTIAVTPDGGNLGIFYYSRQEDPVGNNLFKYYGRVAGITGSTLTFNASTAISDVASFPEFGRDAVVNPSYMGDYNQAAATADGFFVSWSDNRSDLAGGLPRKDPNIYFSTISVTPPPPAPDLAFSSAAISGGNGDALVDQSEVDQLTITLSNNGNAIATGINATLTSNTPGITVTQANSAYADINDGGSGTNTTPFEITMSSGYTCAPARFTLTVNFTGGQKVFNFTLPSSGSIGLPVSFDNNTATAIADNATTDIPITVNNISGSLAKVTLSLYLTHSFDNDLIISLISPDGTTVELSSLNGGGSDNYGSSCSARTIFDDAAATSISSGTAPFTGTFKPEGLLSAFNGKSGADVNGTWTLRIRDVANLDVGTFMCATLNLSTYTCPNPLVTAGTTLVSESCTTPNNVVDPGETVTISLCVKNNGSINSSTLTGTLQNTGGVTNAGAPQNYGVINAGSTVCKDFTFTANGSCGSDITASLLLNDGTTDVATLTYTVHLGVVNASSVAVSITSSIAIPASGSTGAATGAPSDPYPSWITLSGLAGTVSKVTVTLNSFSHTFPDDVDVLLVGPGGQKLLLLSDAGSATDAVNANLTFDDAAAGMIPDNGPLVSGTFKPSNYATGDVFPAPAPAGPYPDPQLLSVFNGTNPNGTWSLYIVDDAGADVGSITGWSLNISTSVSVCCTSTACVLTCPGNTTVSASPGQCGAIVNYPAPGTTGDCGTVTAIPATGSFFPLGTTTVQVSNGVGASCSFTVTVNSTSTEPECSITGSTSICQGELIEWCAPSGMTNYYWTGPNNFSATTACIQVGTAGVYTVSYNGTDGCKRTCSRELATTVCQSNCSYSQGAYGNYKGSACTTGGNTVSENEIMRNVLDNEDGDSVVFGRKDNNRYWVLKLSDVNQGAGSNIYKMLPGGTAAAPLGPDTYTGAPQYSNTASWPVVPLKPGNPNKGRILNSLLAQTITLYFNIHLDQNLASILLNEDTLVTSDAACGSNIVIPGTQAKFGLPHSVVLYLNGGNGYFNNVDGLYKLANDVLGGLVTDVTAPDVQAAVAAVNLAFDGCRILTGTLPYVAPLPLVTRPALTIADEKASGLLVRVAPNPYAYRFNLLVTPPEDGMVRLEFFDAGGKKIFQMERYMKANDPEIVPYTGPFHPGVLLYRVSTGRHSVSGKVIGSN